MQILDPTSSEQVLVEDCSEEEVLRSTVPTRFVCVGPVAEGSASFELTCSSNSRHSSRNRQIQNATCQLLLSVDVIILRSII